MCNEKYIDNWQNIEKQGKLKIVFGFENKPCWKPLWNNICNELMQLIKIKRLFQHSNYEDTDTKKRGKNS